MVPGVSAVKSCRRGDAQSVTAMVETPAVELPSITHSIAMQKQKQKQKKQIQM